MVHLLLTIIYMAFISLGLPDGLLGAAWPSMVPELGAPVSFAGVIFIIISVGTVASSLLSQRLNLRFGPGKVTAVSVAMTAVALFGFASSRSLWQLCLWAVPYGLGAGSVDACLNNYVALHYASRHMSWLHCMWGIGASAGPYIMGAVLSAGQHWSAGYRCIGVIQLVLTALLLLSLPLWKRGQGDGEVEKAKPLRLGEIFAIPGARPLLLAFFCYCALEQTMGLWAGSYLAMYRGFTAEQAAGFAGLFYLGITLGRGLNGFLTMRFSDSFLTRAGFVIVALGIAAVLLPLGQTATLAGLLLVGLGCAPVYPCIIHATPARFGAERSQAVIGILMAGAYLGNCLMPPLFGLIANHISIGLLPPYLLLLLAVMALSHRRAVRICGG
ncbi:MAG: MFS transporter [Candidatus Limivicinus sp.]